MPPLLLPAAAAVLLVLVHAITPELRFLRGVPRSIWLSIAGGVSVAYVFVHLLPELATGQEHVSRILSGTGIHFAERHVYLIALAGLLAFYGLERLAKESRGRTPPPPKGENENAPASPPGSATSPAVFWVHMVSFGIYNALIGYLLLHLERRTVTALAFFGVAMALHFLVTDVGLDEDHKEPYRRIGRWILAVAALIGFAAGYAAEVSDLLIAVLVAFLAAGVVLNVLKEEVPSERQSRFWAFALGGAAYAVLLLEF
jgi:hypothetical protein